MSSQPRGSSEATRPTCRISRSRSLNGSLLVTVESSQLLLVRRAIVQAGREHVGIVRAATIAGGTRVRLLIALDQESTPIVMDAIMRAVSKGEFGRGAAMP